MLLVSISVPFLLLLRMLRQRNDDGFGRQGGIRAQSHPELVDPEGQVLQAGLQRRSLRPLLLQRGFLRDHQDGEFVSGRNENGAFCKVFDFDPRLLSLVLRPLHAVRKRDRPLLQQQRSGLRQGSRSHVANRPGLQVGGFYRPLVPMDGLPGRTTVFTEAL